MDQWTLWERNPELGFEVTREKKVWIDFYFVMVPLRNRSNKKVFKYGTPEPSEWGTWSLRALAGRPRQHVQRSPVETLYGFRQGFMGFRA